MIPVDLSAKCAGWIYDPNGSGIQILGIRSRDPLSGSTDMSGHSSNVRYYVTVMTNTVASVHDQNYILRLSSCLLFNDCNSANA